MTEATYHLLQEKLDKLRIGHRPTNKEFAFNIGVLACKSILKEIYEDSKHTDSSPLGEYTMLCIRFGACAAIAKSKVKNPKYADSYKEGVQACSSIIENYYLSK